MAAIASTGLAPGENGTEHINKKIPTSGTPVCSVKATGTLTIAEPVTAEDSMTIGSVTYTFKAEGTADAAGEIDLGASEAATKLEIVKAILGTDGYNTANPDVICAAAFTSDTLLFTAKEAGTAGNAIVFLEVLLTHASNVLNGSGVLGGTTAGVDGTPGEIGDALIDDTYLYYCVANREDGANWRRISLGSAY